MTDPTDILLKKQELLNVYKDYPSVRGSIKRMSPQQILKLHDRLKKDGKIQ